METSLSTSDHSILQAFVERCYRGNRGSRKRLQDACFEFGLTQSPDEEVEVVGTGGVADGHYDEVFLRFTNGRKPIHFHVWARIVL